MFCVLYKWQLLLGIWSVISVFIKCLFIVSRIMLFQDMLTSWSLIHAVLHGKEELRLQIKLSFPHSSVWRRQWHPTPVLLPGKSHGRRSLLGCSPWGHQESDMTEQLHFHFSLSCIGDGNGNPLQCSCLENPRDWGAWWAAVYGVAQSRIRLKRLSSSSSSSIAQLGKNPPAMQETPAQFLGQEDPLQKG